MAKTKLLTEVNFPTSRNTSEDSGKNQEARAAAFAAANDAWKEARLV